MVRVEMMGNYRVLLRMAASAICCVLLVFPLFVLSAPSRFSPVRADVLIKLLLALFVVGALLELRAFLNPRVLAIRPKRRVLALGLSSGGSRIRWAVHKVCDVRSVEIRQAPRGNVLLLVEMKDGDRIEFVAKMAPDELGCVEYLLKLGDQ